MRNARSGQVLISPREIECEPDLIDKIQTDLNRSGLKY